MLCLAIQHTINTTQWQWPAAMCETMMQIYVDKCHIPTVKHADVNKHVTTQYYNGAKVKVLASVSRC